MATEELFGLPRLLFKPRRPQMPVSVAIKEVKLIRRERIRMRFHSKQGREPRISEAERQSAASGEKINAVWNHFTSIS
jgi:hypothetical protein